MRALRRHRLLQNLREDIGDALLGDLETNVADGGLTEMA